MTKKHKWLLGLEMLPDDVLVEIFLRLPSESVCRIRCVSKKFCKIVDCRLFATLHQSSAGAAAAEVPRLLITIQSDFIRDDRNPEYRHPQYPRNQENSNSLQPLKYDPATSSLSPSSSSGSGDVIKLFNLGDFHVVSIFRNLFCFANRHMSIKEHMGNLGRQSCFLFNPLAHKGGELLMLPQHSKPFFWYGMGMGFDHTTKTTSKLKIIGIPIQLPIIEASYIYEFGTGGSSSWRQIRSPRPTNLSPSTGVSAFGNMYYWLVPTAGKLFRILSFDFNTEEFTLIPHPEFSRSLHLVNLRGSLAAVNTAAPSKHIEIWVLTHPNKQWTLDYKFRKDAFLTGPHRGKLKHCGEWEHGLFFVQVHGISPGATSTNAIFLDLRCGGSFKRVFFPDKFGDGRQLSEWAGRLISFTGSMISLKHYGNLLQPRQGEWHIDFENTTTQVEAITAC